MNPVVQSSTAAHIANTVGWTLLHFVWQGALVAVILACILRLLAKASAQLRYLVACAALVLMAGIPIITVVRISAIGQTAEESLSATRVFQPRVGEHAEAWSPGSLTYGVVSVLDRFMPQVLAIWLMCVAIFQVRLIIGFIAVRRMKSAAIFPPSSELLQAFHRVAHFTRIRYPVKIVQSAIAQVPTVIGWIQPVILFPPGCASGLSPSQLEAVLAHELAHVYRCDYLVNVSQLVIETVLFYHPATWWVSNQIRREREHCCDDLAVAVCGDRLSYARALSVLEVQRSPIAEPALGATGGLLKMRISRLLGLNQPPTCSRMATCVLLLVVANAAGLIVWGSLQAQPIASQPHNVMNQYPPTHSQENGQAVGAAADIPVQVRSLTIVSSDLPDVDRTELVKTFQGRTFSLEELVERIRRNLQDRSYAKSAVQLLSPLQAPSGMPASSMDISVRVSAGAHYTLGGYSIKGARVLSRNVIIQQFSLNPGSPINVTAISDGLDRVRALYRQKGYRGFAIETGLQTEDTYHVADLVLDIEEGQPNNAD